MDEESETGALPGILLFQLEPKLQKRATMPNDFALTYNDLFNESLAAGLLFGYLAYAIRATYEIKSVVANTATLFGGSLAFRIQAFASDINDEN